MSERVPVEAITPQQMWDVVRAALNEDAGLRATLHARLEREGVSLTLGDAETMARALAAPSAEPKFRKIGRIARDLLAGRAAGGAVKSFDTDCEAAEREDERRAAGGPADA